MQGLPVNQDHTSPLHTLQDPCPGVAEVLAQYIPREPMEPIDTLVHLKIACEPEPKVAIVVALFLNDIPIARAKKC